MKRMLATAALVLVSALLGSWLGSVVHAQGTTVLQVTGAWSTHVSCSVTPAQATLCLSSDGLWISINGAAFTQVGVPAAAGVTSIAVCDATGANCAAAQTGAVSLNIPKTATVTAPAATLK